MPDAKVKNKGIVQKVRNEFYRYMRLGLSEDTDKSLGINSSRLYSKVRGVIDDCPLEFSKLNGNSIFIEFDKNCGQQNHVSVSRTSEDSDFQFLVNRRYNDLGRVAGVCLVSFLNANKFPFSIYLSSSEFCRGIEEPVEGGIPKCESVNDLQLTVRNDYIDYCTSIKSHYALADRSKQFDIMNTIMADIKDYVSGVKDGFADTKTLDSKLRSDEGNKGGLIFKEGLENLQTGCLGFEVKNGGFEVWYPAKDGLLSPWKEVYFHNNYDNTDVGDVEQFRRLFENTAYDVLKVRRDCDNDLDNIIKTKLKVVSKLIDNKKKFEKVHPPEQKY